MGPDIPADEEAPTCVVRNIKVTTAKIANKYYLTWNGVENATKYIVYRSDRETNVLADMNKVGETTDTRFEYRYDQNADRDLYAFYAVEALCADGATVMIDDAEKVHV